MLATESPRLVLEASTARPNATGRLPQGWLVVACAASLWLFSPSAFAADTLETYDLGASDFELYAGYGGIGLKRSAERSVLTQAYLGYGLTERWSGFVQFGASGNDRFSAGEGEFGFGTFATVLDTNHFDLDLALSSTHCSGAISMMPSLEFNLDAIPELAANGLYLRVGEELTGRDDSTPDDPTTAGDEGQDKHTFTPSTAFTLGAYYTIADGQQLLVEYDMVFHHGKLGPAEAAPPRVEVGGVVLGYNRGMLDNLELITQLGLDMPNAGEPISGSILVGFIATLSTLRGTGD